MRTYLGTSKLSARFTITYPCERNKLSLTHLPKIHFNVDLISTTSWKSFSAPYEARIVTSSSVSGFSSMIVHQSWGDSTSFHFRCVLCLGFISRFGMPISSTT